MRKPTDKDIEKAESYLRKRLEAEISMRTNLERVMKEAAEKVVAISYRYNIVPSQFRFSANKDLQHEVDEVITWLREQIEDYTYTLAVAEHEEEKDAILTYITRESYGKTFAQRNAIYCNRFKYELEAGIAAALIIGAKQKEAVNAIGSSLMTPYNNPHIREAIGKGKATRLLSGGVSYGRGRTNSMTNALLGLTQFAVAEGWAKYQKLTAKASGKKGFYSYRGSSYPCALCDSMRGFHPLSDPMPPYHRRCCCYVVFTDEAEGTNNLPEDVKERRKEIRSLAKDKWVGKQITHPKFKGHTVLTYTNIKEWLSQPHEHFAAKNELILDIQTVFERSKYIGYIPDKHNPDDVKAHLFETVLLGDKSYIIVREFKNGECRLHSISDSMKRKELKKRKLP